MRCLLDKVTARYIMGGLVKLSEERPLTDAELLALDLYNRAVPSGIALFILPETERVLQHLGRLPHYAPLILLFRSQTQVTYPTRYFKRWARRLRDYGFTREDAGVLAIATFGTTATADVLGMHTVATFDQPMINLWRTRQTAISTRLGDMLRNLREPYCYAPLPKVQRPEDILGS
jgi:hypothetical protein